MGDKQQQIPEPDEGIRVHPFTGAGDADVCPNCGKVHPVTGDDTEGHCIKVHPVSDDDTTEGHKFRGI